MSQEGDQAPYFPAMIMLVSKKNGNLLPAEACVADGNDYSELLEKLAQAWLNEGNLPRKIMARDERTVCFLKDICEKLGVVISDLDTSFPNPDEVQDRMMDEFEAEYGLDLGRHDKEYMDSELEAMMIAEFILQMKPKEIKQIPKGMIHQLRQMLDLGLFPKELAEPLRKKLTENGN